MVEYRVSKDLVRSIVWLLFIYLLTRTISAQYDKKYGNAGKYLNSYRCELGMYVNTICFYLPFY